MHKILVCDHKFNVESISSCSQQEELTKFYGLNPKMSFYDNFDTVNPDTVWINNSFFSIENYDLKNIPTRVVQYSIPYIIPNIFAQIPSKSEAIISCILFNNHKILPNKIYQYDNYYIRFYTIASDTLDTIQHCGRILTCKDLTDIICSSEKILIDDNIISGLCSFYNKPYGLFKPKGTISWITSSKEIITNSQLFSYNKFTTFFNNESK